MSDPLNQMRKDALEIFQAGVAAVEPMRAVFDHLALDKNILTAAGSRLDLSLVDQSFWLEPAKQRVRWLQQ